MPINFFNTEIGMAGYSEKNYQTKRHAHFTIEVAFALKGSLGIMTHRHKYSDVDALIIGSNLLHSFDCLDSECQIFFFDPTSAVSERLFRNYELEANELVLLPTEDRKKLKEAIDLISAGKRPGLQSKSTDNRIQKCLDWIESNYMTEGVTIARLAEEMFLSPDRAAHLFKEEVGTSIHQYILWKRIDLAAKMSLDGYSLTECAHACGFTDSAHFNRVFKKMFGVNPSFALRR